MKNAIILFVKNPTPGRVKTRLALEFGNERAAEIYRELVGKVCGLLPNEVEVFVACEPASEISPIRAWLERLLPGAQFIAQHNGDLGARLADAFAHVFSRGYDRVAVVGSDCVEIDGRTFDEAFDALAACDCAIGPAVDGGYYLLALKKPTAGIFHDIPWSSPATFARTIDRAAELGLRVHELPILGDVDTPADWQRVQKLLRPQVVQISPV